MVSLVRRRAANHVCSWEVLFTPLSLLRFGPVSQWQTREDDRTKVLYGLKEFPRIGHQG